MQVQDTLYLIDTLKLRQPSSLMQDRQLLKITAEVTSTSADTLRKFIEVNSDISCREMLFNGIDLRQRPIKQDVIQMIVQDF
jgi:hypothetical protein